MATVTPKKPIFIDVNMNFGQNSYPELLYDEDAIRNSLLNILTTPIGSRAFVPEYGSRLYKFLQEPIDPVTSVQIEELLIQAIIKWEPRVQVIRSKTKVTPSSNGFDILLTYYILPSKRVSNFEVNVVQNRN